MYSLMLSKNSLNFQTGTMEVFSCPKTSSSNQVTKRGMNFVVFFIFSLA